MSKYYVQDKIKELEAQLEKAIELLDWYVKNEDVQDTEYNAYWIEGYEKARKFLYEHRGEEYQPLDWFYFQPLPEPKGETP